MSKPRLFIGSSVEGLSVAYAIQENLKYVTEATVWDQGVFNLSESSLESLLVLLDTCDFGVFVFSPDDHIKIRGKKDLAVRDNVLFELGLFIGRLGRQRCFIIIPDNREFHLPTDLIGVTPAIYEASRTDNNLQAGTGSASHKLRENILKLGITERIKEEPETNDQEETETKSDDWYYHLYIDKNFDAAIKDLKKKIRYERDYDSKVSLKGNLCYAEYSKDAKNGKLAFEKLISENKANNIAYLAYATALYYNNSFNKSLEIIEEGLLHCERKINLTTLKVDCLWETNQQEVAFAFLIKSMESLNDPLLYLKLALLYSKIDKKDEALEVSFRAFNEYPINEDVVSFFAKIAYDLGHKDVCVLLYRELLEIDNENYRYWCLLGNAYLDLGYYNLAFEAYENANKKSDGKEGWVLSNLGNLFNRKGLYDKAEYYLLLSQKVDEKSEYTHGRLSQVYKAKQADEKNLLELLRIAKAKVSGDILK
ncbi:TIR domain-containing protein [Leptospira interrogans]|nr:TIR domain-containing protein [Leptospira interrogans]